MSHLKFKVTETYQIGPRLWGGKQTRSYESECGSFRIYQRYTKGDGYSRAGYHWVLVDFTNMRDGRPSVNEGLSTLRSAKAQAARILDRHAS